jgi:phenylacetate-coenzyme A ligase PaaK-like adenylate-forming protein
MPIVEWMTTSLRRGDIPYLRTFPSSAVRICEAALRNGDDLTGAQFQVSGEPLTPARQAAVERSGASVASSYGSSESGNAGKGCLAPIASDEVHFFSDLLAVIQPGDQGATASLPSRALLLTSLRASSRFILLNVSMGDQGELEDRRCGCAMAELGWTTHLKEIRSFEKLATGGMTFLDTAIIQVLEEALPHRFGGGPTDYQLVEEEDAGGKPCLRLREAFLTAIAPGTGTERVMAQVWRDANFVQVERKSPQATSTGKIQHLRAARAFAGARESHD